MAIDFIKAKIINPNIEKIKNNPSLDFKMAVSSSTGEIALRETAIYHQCKIEITNNKYVRFSGSIHKMWNSLNGVYSPKYIRESRHQQVVNKGFNGNIFTLHDILEVREHLTKLLFCVPSQMEFKNIEFGVNTEPNFYNNLFLKGLLYHNGKLFEYKYNNCFAQSVHQKFILKIYNKSEQYGMDTETLRIELKYLKMTEVNLIGIKTFADINENTLKGANELLLKRFKETNYYDYTINKKTLTKRQKKTVVNYSNPRYWFEDITVKKRYEHKIKLKEFIVNNSDNLHRQLINEIELKGGIITRHSKTLKGGTITHSSIGIIIPPTRSTIPHKKQQQEKGKRCLVTGINISMQKDDSILLSHTGLIHYFNTNKKEYNFIKNKYLSKKWADADFKTQIKEMAHNIRNRHNSIKRGNELVYKPRQGQLFVTA